MKILAHFYTLASKTMLRKGALIQAVFGDGKIGYADCHPWPELNDAPLLEQIRLLKQKKLTSLTERSLFYARADAQARAEQRNLFKDLVIPQSHSLIYDLSTREKSLPPPEIVKVKVGRDPISEAASLQSFLDVSEITRLRLDGNERFTLEECKKFLGLLQPWKDRIDFFEDPIPYEAAAWQEIQNEFSIPLASDRKSDQYLGPEYPHRVSVIKPACQDPELFIGDFRRLVVTSYMDHPLGQLAAAYTAAQIASQFPQKVGICGLLTHTLYESTPFSERLSIQNGQLIPPSEGYGFGYDDLLATLKWEALI